MEKIIWVFVAYKNVSGDIDEKGGVPFFSKLFDDHTQLKTFSAKHSAEHKKNVSGYNSTYFELTDTQSLSKAHS